jgi:hypothetical protein
MNRTCSKNGEELCRILVGKTEGKRPQDTQIHIGVDIIKMYLKRDRIWLYELE